MNFGENLRAMRKSKGWTQENLSAESGVLQELICRYEKGDNLPSITSLEWLVKALDTTATELLGF